MIVDDPTDDVPGLECPDESPDILKPKQEVRRCVAMCPVSLVGIATQARVHESQTVPERLQEGDDIDGNNGRTEEEIEQALKRQEAQTRARTLEIVRQGVVVDHNDNDAVVPTPGIFLTHRTQPTVAAWRPA